MYRNGSGTRTAKRITRQGIQSGQARPKIGCGRPGLFRTTPSNLIGASGLRRRSDGGSSKDGRPAAAATGATGTAARGLHPDTVGTRGRAAAANASLRRPNLLNVTSRQGDNSGLNCTCSEYRTLRRLKSANCRKIGSSTMKPRNNTHNCSSRKFRDTNSENSKCRRKQSRMLLAMGYDSIESLKGKPAANLAERARGEDGRRPLSTLYLYRAVEYCQHQLDPAKCKWWY